MKTFVGVLADAAAAGPMRWYAVDVLRLIEELRKHPERAPRAAQFVTTHA